MNTKEAMQVLRVALHKDDGYAIVWHCNIAMCVYDSFGPALTESESHNERHRIGNEAAERFMKLCFNVDGYMPIEKEDKK